MPKLSHFFDRKVLSITFFINNEHPAEQKIYFHATFVKKNWSKLKTQSIFIDLQVSFKNQVFEGKRHGVPKKEYQVFLCIFQKNSAMATLGLKEMQKILPST